jgi:sensor histidine kinase YesM
MYWVITRMDSLPMFENPNRIFGIGMIAISGMLVAPWVAMAALMRSRDDAVRSQAMNFAQERSALERQNQFARLRLLQAQVQPHFLFNTLANVRELVESKSDKAPAVLNSLIAYLRAAVPKLNETTTSVAQELALVRAYLEVMHMRIPDRLAFTVEATDESLDLICPPMMLMTLVENAVRHGIDQSTSGGTVAVRVCVQSDTCLAQVTDSGVGLGKTRNGLGTGLSTLRQRLKLMFGDDAELSMAAVDPLGTKATVRFPATRDGE